MKPVEALGVTEIDLSDRTFWRRPLAEREGAFATLRRERPLAFFAEPDLRDASPLAPPPGPGYRALTRHAEVTEVSRRPDVYRSGPGAVSILDMPPEMVDYFSGMISTDNPRHARLRRIVSAAFTPRRVRAIEDDIEQVAKDVVAEVAARGECDFVTDVAAKLPLRVICEMMGVDPADEDDVFRCSNIILSNGDSEYVPEGEDPIFAFISAGRDLTALMERVAEKRLSAPADDLVTALITTNIDGEALTHAELASFFILLAVAGNETTRTAIAHGLWALTEHEEARALWQADVSGLSARAVEEIVRWASPVIWMRRTVAEDTELAGEHLSPGDKVLLLYASANRDEAVFDDPFRFDLARHPNPHLGFGAAGPHFCLGAHLARREIAAIFAELFCTLPDVRATGEPDRLDSSFINGIKHLSCTYTPVG